MSAARARLATLALALAACTPVERPSAPLDRFTFPTGLALHDGRLVVVSSNYDLRYQDEKGGSVLSVDPAAWVAGTRTFTGGLRIPSFGGDLAVATAAACGIAESRALVASRLTGHLYRLGLDAGGALSCGEGCEVKLAEPGDADPFAIEVLCRPNAPPLALVGWLRSGTGGNCGSGQSASTTCAKISEVRLDRVNAIPQESVVVFNQGGIRQLRYDAETDLLFFVTTGSAVGWVDLSSDCEIGSTEHACLAQAVDLRGAVSGLEVRSLAFSSGTPRRLFVAARLIDPAAAATGIRIDVGGALVVLDLETSPTGGYGARLVRVVPLATGMSQVIRLPPRPGRGDVLALTGSEDGEIWFYDDGIGAVTGVLGRGRNGAPLVGSMPYGMAVEDLGTAVRLYVGSFGDSVVSVVDVNPDDPDPLADPPGAVVVGRIGG